MHSAVQGDKYGTGIEHDMEIAGFIKTACIVRININSVSDKDSFELTRKRNSKLKQIH